MEEQGFTWLKMHPGIEKISKFPAQPLIQNIFPASMSLLSKLSILPEYKAPVYPVFK